MGEVSVNSSGLLSKISSLFNSPLFSDVTFVFRSKLGHTEEMYGHKLILALRSKEFARQFYGEREPTNLIEIPANKKPVFEVLLRFLYTDDVQFHTFEEAQDLTNLANTYDIEELKEKCHQFMLQEKITIENIFLRYECALKKNITLLLKNCRDFVCSYAELVLKSKDFTSASAYVVEDIIKQNGLLIPTELDVITAVLNWGKEELERNNLPFDEKQLREHINQFMKHLRFLTLSSQEFDYFVEYHNILSARESSVLTRKILQPECNVNIPNNICSITVKRGMLSENSSILDQSSLDLNCIKSDSPKLVMSNYWKSSTSESNKPIISDSSKSSEYWKSSAPDSTKPIISDSCKITDYWKSSTSECIKPIISDSFNSTEVKSGEFLSNKIQYEVRKCATYATSKEQKSSFVGKQTRYTTNKSDMSSYFIPQTFCSPGLLSQNGPREYSFPLSDIQPCLDMSFPRDIKCSITIRVKNGYISLRGFELKIKNERNEKDNLEAFVHMTGFSESLSRFYKNKLHNNIFRVEFDKPMILKEEEKGELEVSIDGLFLNRCSACGDMDGKPFELNKGLGFAVQFYLKSNKKCNDGFLFLISKLLF